MSINYLTDLPCNFRYKPITSFIKQKFKCVCFKRWMLSYIFMKRSSSQRDKFSLKMATTIHSSLCTSARNSISMWYKFLHGLVLSVYRLPSSFLFLHIKNKRQLNTNFSNILALSLFLLRRIIGVYHWKCWELI